MKTKSILMLPVLACLCLATPARAASFSASGTTLTIDMNVASQGVTVTSLGTSYTFTLGATYTWTGSATGCSASGNVLTVNATGLATYDTFNITDSAPGAMVSFADSGTRSFSDNLNVNLTGGGGVPGAVTFFSYGTNNFTGANGISITTSGNIVFNTAAMLSTVNGNLTLNANTQAVSSAFNAVGVLLNGSVTVQATGSGVVTVKGRAGSGASTSGYGVSLGSSARLLGGTSGTLTVQGWGAEARTGANIQLYGVYVSGGSVASGWATISSLGANVVVTGTGGAGVGASSGSSYGVFVGGTSSGSGGVITSGGNGTVTVTGTGDGSAVPTAGQFGVNVSGNYALISSGGSGLVTVTGTGGGIASGTYGDMNGVCVQLGGVITSGAGGSVNVTGYGGTAALGATSVGVFLTTASSPFATITCGAGAGTVTVTGTGGGAGSGNYHYGVYIAGGAVITSGGAGAVTVTGKGGGSTGFSQHGVLVASSSPTIATITSGGGNVTVNGTGGGTGSGGSAHGVLVNSGGLITAGGTGAVNVTGTGCTNGTGGVSIGVSVSGGTAPIFSTITSSGGNVTVNGTGGGLGSSSDDYGVSIAIGGKIMAGGAGTVSVTGNGGNLTGTGGNQRGVYINGGTSPDFSVITSSGGNVTVTGTGGGAGAGTYNYGVYISGSGRIMAGGTGAVNVTGNGGTAATGNGQNGVYVNGGTSPNFSIITSSGGNVTVNGTGGGTGTSRVSYGVIQQSGGQITSGPGASVTVVGVGGAGGGGYNHGLHLQDAACVLSSGGGPVSITVTEGSGTTSIGINSYGGVITTATNGGTLTLVGDSLILTSGSIVGAGPASSLTIRPRRAAVAVNLGSDTDTAGGPLALSPIEIASLSGGTINIGSAASGNVTNSAIVTFASGSDVRLYSAAAPTGFFPKAAGTGVTLGAGKTLTLSSGSALGIAINGTLVNISYDQLNVAGALNLTGLSLALSGSYTPAGGDVFTIVSATSITGTLAGLAEGATVAFNGKNLTIHYTATAVTLTASKTATTNIVTSSLNPSTYGSSVTFTSTVSPSAASGNVAFKDGAATLGTVTLSGGIATLTTSNLAAGSHSITAEYAGDSNYNGSTNSPALTQTVNSLPPTATTLAATVVGATNATLNSSVNPNGSSTDVYFQYSTDSSLGLVASTLAGSTQGFADGTGAAARFWAPYGVVADSAGNAFVSDANNCCIRKISLATRAVTTLAGSVINGFADGTGSAARFNSPFGLALDNAGYLFVGDRFNNRIRKIDVATGTVTTLAGGTQGFADGTGAAARFYYPAGVAVDSSGNLYVADSANHRIRKIVVATGAVTTLAGSGTAGFADATGVAAQFNGPNGVALDGAGNLFVADLGNNRIRKIVVATGAVTTLAGSGTGGFADGTGTAAQFRNPTGLAVGSAGSLLVADQSNNRIRKVVIATGVVTTLAGSGTSGFADGNALAAKFYSPIGVAVDSAGNVLVADADNNRIRMVGPAPLLLAQSGLTGSSPVPVSLPISNLLTGTTYYFRVMATNSAGSTNGDILSFTTTVPKLPTTNTLASSLNPSIYGSSVTFTSTVSPTAATGTATFKDGATTLGMGTLSGGSATFSTSALTVGGHSITAEYPGDSSYNGSTNSPALSQTVNKATPGVTTWPTASAITQGQALSASTLTGGSASVAGSFDWETPATVPPAGTNAENVVFTPSAYTSYISVTGSVSVVVNASGPVTRQPVLSGPWNDPATWGGTLPAPTDSVVIPSGFTVTVTNSPVQVANLTIIGTLAMPGAKTIQISGNFTNNGTFTTGSSTVEFLGSGNSVMSATAPGSLTFVFLKVNKDSATNTVNALSKVKVNRKLDVARGQYYSASDYADILIDADGEMILSNSITISGNFTNAGSFTANGFGVTFDGGTTQYLSLPVMTWFDDLTVSVGTTLVESETFDNVVVNGTVLNQGVISKTQPVTAVDMYFFGLAGRYADHDVVLDMTSLAGANPVTAIQMHRRDANPPSAPGTNSTPIYWTITPTGSDCVAEVVLPHAGLPDPQVCRCQSSRWTAARTSFDTDRVTLVGVTSLSGDWAVFNGGVAIAVNDTLGAFKNTPKTAATSVFLANDTVAAGYTLTLVSVSYTGTNGGAVSLSGTNVIYTPATNYLGADEFTYTVSDGVGGTAVATVAVTVSDQGQGNPPKPGGIVVDGPKVTLTFQGVPNRTYRVQYTLTLSPADWQDLGTAKASRTGIITYEDTPPGGPGSRFYRVVYP